MLTRTLHIFRAPVRRRFWSANCYRTSSGCSGFAYVLAGRTECRWVVAEADEKRSQWRPDCPRWRRRNHRRRSIKSRQLMLRRRHVQSHTGPHCFASNITSGALRRPPSLLVLLQQSAQYSHRVSSDYVRWVGSVRISLRRLLTVQATAAAVAAVAAGNMVQRQRIKTVDRAVCVTSFT